MSLDATEAKETDTSTSLLNSPVVQGTGHTSGKSSSVSNVDVHIHDCSQQRKLLSAALPALVDKEDITGLHLQLPDPLESDTWHNPLTEPSMWIHEEEELGSYLCCMTQLRSLSIQGVSERDPTGMLGYALSQLVNLTCLQGCGVQPARCLAPIVEQLTALQVSIPSCPKVVGVLDTADALCPTHACLPTSPMQPATSSWV